MTSHARWLVALLASFLAAAFLSSCVSKQETSPPIPTFTPYPPYLYIGLSEAAAPLAGLVSSAYEDESGRTAPKFILANDELLLRDLNEDKLEAVIVHHLPADSQHWFSPVALDGVVFLTNPESVVADLSRDDVQAIFGGAIDSWAAVGGPNLAISVVSREAGSGARAILEERIMDNLPLTGLALIAPEDRFMIEKVAANEGAIGYSMLGSVGTKSGITFEGIAPSPETVADQSYPLTTPIYFVTEDEPSGELREFLAWLQSPTGQNVLDEKYGRLR